MLKKWKFIILLIDFSLVPKCGILYLPKSGIQMAHFMKCDLAQVCLLKLLMAFRLTLNDFVAMSKAFGNSLNYRRLTEW